MWDDYHVFLFATFAITRLLLDEIYHLTELSFDWLMMECEHLFFLLEIFLGFRYSNFFIYSDKYIKQNKNN